MTISLLEETVLNKYLYVILQDILGEDRFYYNRCYTQKSHVLWKYVMFWWRLPSAWNAWSRRYGDRSPSLSWAEALLFRDVPRKLSIHLWTYWLPKLLLAPFQKTKCNSHSGSRLLSVPTQLLSFNTKSPIIIAHSILLYLYAFTETGRFHTYYV